MSENILTIKHLFPIKYYFIKNFTLSVQVIYFLPFLLVTVAKLQKRNLHDVSKSQELNFFFLKKERDILKMFLTKLFQVIEFSLFERRY